MPQSTGTLKYIYEPEYGYKLIVVIDPEIVLFARSLVPKSIKLNKQKYAPHISVVRKEKPKINWGLRDGLEVQFCYDNYIYNDETYYWLRVFSEDLVRIRVSLGLTPYSEWAKPPDGTDCFHITIGNCKDI